MTADPRFLKCSFRRRLAWKEAEDGRILIFRPRLGEGKLGKWLESLLGLAPYRIRLDEIGTLVWKNCDGNTSAQQMADQLRSKFGEKVEPAEDRLQHFITQLNRSRMIEVNIAHFNSTGDPLD